jgi:methylase of polypeptide subunit release factors
MSDLAKNPLLGQVWTPDTVAVDMANSMLAYMPSTPLRILDPSSGPGTFSKALSGRLVTSSQMHCFDIDPRMSEASRMVMEGEGIQGISVCVDYLAEPIRREFYDAAILNPPYIRHEQIAKSSKKHLQSAIKDSLGVDVDARSNLFVYFVLKAIAETKVGGVVAFIVYDAIGNTLYGQKALDSVEAVAEILDRTKVKAPFDNAIIDAEVILVRRRDSIKNVQARADKAVPEGLTPLGELVHVRRGTALPKREFFVSKDDHPMAAYAVPFLRKQDVNALVVSPDCNAFLQRNELKGEESRKIIDLIASSMGRAQVSLPRPISGSIVFNYYVRNRPRHLFNPDGVPVADNFYAIEPKEISREAAWLLLNSSAFLDPIVNAGKSQGNGLTKLQVYAYRRAIVPDWRRIRDDGKAELTARARCLIGVGAPYDDVRKEADLGFDGAWNE